MARPTLKALLAVISITACGQQSNLEVEALRGHGGALSVHQAADAVLLQPNASSTKKARVSAAGFERITDVAVNDEHIFVLDSELRRVLIFDNGNNLETGVGASMVINQNDFFDTEQTNVPAAQQATFTGIAVDSRRRLYLHHSTKVLVFEPDGSGSTSYDGVADGALQGLPGNITRIRELSADLLAVVGSTAITFYRQGDSSPLAQYSLTMPSACSLSDISMLGVHLLVSCSGRIVAYEFDGATGFFLPTPTQMYDLGAGTITNMQAHGTTMLVSQRGQNRLLRFTNVEAHLNARFTDSDILINPLGVATDAVTFYGQADAASTLCNRGNALPLMNRLCGPGPLALHGPNAWVGDTSNYRVLAFNGAAGSGSPSIDAAIALGQPTGAVKYRNRLEDNAADTVGGVVLSGGSGGGALYIADSVTHRVLRFDNVNDLGQGPSAGGDARPTAHYGQSDGLSYFANGPLGTISGSTLNSPSHVAVDAATNNLYISDQGNSRIVIHTNDDAVADATVGSNAFTVAGNHAYGALTVYDRDLFVATAAAPGNPSARVFMYKAPQTGNLAGDPDRVFGQTDANGGACNRGNAGAPRADTLCDVRGVALDGEGRLWVADSGNRRILWFDDPTGDDDRQAITADGVVGQKDFVSKTAGAGIAGGRNAYGFTRPAGIAVSASGQLWVVDESDHRVLVFEQPMQGDAVRGLPIATTVLGQSDFSSRNSTAPGLLLPTAGTLKAPTQIAVDEGMRMVFVSDTGNHRVLRYTMDSPRIVRGGGHHTAAAGSIKTATLELIDHEGDALDSVQLVEPIDDDITLNNLTVQFDARQRVPGERVVATLQVSETGPLQQVTQVTVIFRVVDDPHAEQPFAQQPRQRPVPEVESCAALPSWPSYGLLGAALATWYLRRRRR